MLGVVRLYLEHRDDVPSQYRRPITHPVIDCMPDQVRDVRRALLKAGYTVLAVPL